MKHNLFLFFLFIAVFPIAIYAQESKQNFYSILTVTQEDGLPQSIVNCVMKDKAGFMWFGTQSGLARYDGYNFLVYGNNAKDSNSISDSYIETLFQDKDGLIWIGGFNNGLSSINTFTNKINRYNLPNPNRVRDFDKIFSIAEDNNGIIWIGTGNGGIFYSNKEKTSFTQFVYRVIPNNILSITPIGNNTIWFSIDGTGLYKIRYGAKVIDVLETKLISKTTNKDISTNSIYATKADAKGNLWFSQFPSKLACLNLKNEKISLYDSFLNGSEKVTGFEIPNIFIDEKNNIWVGTKGEGIFVKAANSTTFLKIIDENYFFKNSPINNVLSIGGDNQGAIWLGTLGGGAVAIGRKKSNFISYKPVNNNSPNATENIFTIFVDELGTVWKSKAGAGVDYRSYGSKEFKSFVPKKDLTKHGLNDIYCMEEDNNAIYFCPHLQNIIRFDKTTQTLEALPNKELNKLDVVRAVKFNNKIFFGTYGSGLYFIEQNAKKPVLFSQKDVPSLQKITDQNINCLEVFDDKYLLVGTERGGLNVFDKNLNLVKTFSKSNKEANISNDFVLTLSVDDNKNVWIGTFEEGLDLIFNFDEFITQKDIKLKLLNFNKSQKLGICDNSIFGIVPDKINKYNYWISTNNGLSRISLKPILFDKMRSSNKFTNDLWAYISIKNFTINDGLPSSEFNGNARAINNSGEIFMGTPKGLVSFFPDSSIYKSIAPPIVYTQFKLFEKEYLLDTIITFKKQINLTYKQSFFSFEFAALNFQGNEQNQYAYMMEGFDKEWIFAGNRRFASYTNLDPGDYAFKVKASNDGTWKDEYSYIRITITPPWYKTTWAYILFIIVAGGCIYSFIKYRELKLNSEKKILEHKVDERTKEIAIINKEIIKKNEDITDSINYAKRIQQAILPPIEELKANFTDSFILYQPKDIVSGDFYWLFKSELENQEKQLFLAAADCTGHGVPGAFMSMISIDKLNEAAKYFVEPAKVLEYINVGIKLALRQSGDIGTQSRDGLDIALCRLIKVSNTMCEVSFAGANRPMWILRKNATEIEEIKATKAAIGGFTHETQEFKQHTIVLHKGDCFYIFSDGYPDQFGGQFNKKFMTKKLREEILSLSNKPMYEQKLHLENSMKNWQGNYEQVDDILVIGLRI